MYGIFYSVVFVGVCSGVVLCCSAAPLDRVVVILLYGQPVIVYNMLCLVYFMVPFCDVKTVKAS